jgi:hypothetical protein
MGVCVCSSEAVGLAVGIEGNTGWQTGGLDEVPTGWLSLRREGDGGGGMMVKWCGRQKGGSRVGVVGKVEENPRRILGCKEQKKMKVKEKQK